MSEENLLFVCLSGTPLDAGDKLPAQALPVQRMLPSCFSSLSSITLLKMVKKERTPGWKFRGGGISFLCANRI